MSIFVVKAYFERGSSMVVGTFSSLLSAQRASEKVYPTSDVKSCMILEFDLDKVNNDRKNAWEYSGLWNSL